jgi:tetratricopeptide (TPR) repeat protein
VDEVRRLILETYDGLRQKDYFEVLGIDRKASEADIRVAYARFARVLHPDACRDEAHADLQEQREAVFIRVGEAYETLRNASSRAKYENAYPPRRRPRGAPAAGSSSQPPEPSPPESSPATESQAPITPDPEREAAEALDEVRAAELLIREQQYWDAIQQLELVIARTQGPVQSRARVALARAYLKNPKWKHRAEEVLQQAVRESPDYAEAYVVLGNVYGEGKLVSRATSMYRKALELRPGHPEAEAGLAALEAESQASRATGTLRLRDLFRKG